MKRLLVTLTQTEVIEKEYAKVVEVPNEFDPDDQEQVSSLVDYLHTLDLGEPTEECPGDWSNSGMVEELPDEDGEPEFCLVRTKEDWEHVDMKSNL